MAETADERRIDLEKAINSANALRSGKGIAVNSPCLLGPTVGVKQCMP